MARSFPGPYNGYPVVGITIALAIIAFCLITWRMTYRYSKGVIVASDYLLIAGASFAFCQAGFNVGAYMNWGYGYHKANLPDDVAKSLTPKLLFFLNQIFFKAAAGLVKLSICFVYLGLFRDPIAPIPRIIERANQVLISVIITYYSSATFISMFQCSPVQKGFNAKLDGKCIHLDQFRLANGYINVITSIWLIAMPFPVILSLAHRNSERFQFLGLIGLGVIHTGCAVYRVVNMYQPNEAAKTDPTWANTAGNTFGMLELFIGIIAATIITMRRCFRGLGRFVHGAVAQPSQVLRSGASISRSGQSRQDSYANADYRSSKNSNNNGGDIESSNESKSIARTDVELESRNRSTEQLYSPGRTSYANSLTRGAENVEDMRVSQ